MCPVGSYLYGGASDQAEVCCRDIVLPCFMVSNNLGRKLGDHTYLSWNNEQASTVTATGRDLRPE